MKSQIKKKKLPSKSTISNKLDKICSEIVRFRGYCEWCNKADHTLQCAHIYSRTYKSVRWDLKNLLCLCASCHFFGHKNPTLFSEFVIKYLGSVEYEYLKQRATPTSHHKIHNLIDLYESLKTTKEIMYDAQ